MFKKITGVILAAAILLSGLHVGIDRVNAGQPDFSREKVKNIIFLIPDGYSTAFATNYRWYKGADSVMDTLLVGMMKTHSANSEVTDSAAAGTAMATGVKTNNGMISVTPDGQAVKTILEAAEETGKSSGLVATSTITHATPAVFASHVSSRGSEADIAPQLLEKVDVLLGGGKQFFLPESMGGRQKERNLIEEAKQAGYQYTEDRDQLLDVKGDKVLGLFAQSGMAPELDRDETNQPSLEEMTAKAIEVLKKDKDGFFLVVEGSQIDWAGHAHDAAWAMKDTEAFEEAVKVALDFARENGKTLVIIAGDHDTGGMSVGGYGKYDAQLEILRSVTATGDFMAGKLHPDRSNLKDVVKTYANIELTENEVQIINNAINNKVKPANAINDVISQRALVGWTSGAHTGVDVPLYAFGPGADAFKGLHDNTELPVIMAEVMKIDF
jgi:alkaline phosphatase